MSVKVVKRILESGEEVHIMRNHVPEKEIQIYILVMKSKKAFFFSISDVQLRAMAAELRVNYDRYLAETLDFFGSTAFEGQYLFQLLNNEEEYTFKWKKQVADKGAKILYGEKKLELRDFDSTVIEALHKSSSEFERAIKERDIQIINLKEKEKTLVETERLLEQVLTEKVNLEKELYTKFLLVLNNKKARIAELHKTIQMLEGNKNKKQNQKAKSKSPMDIPKPGPSNAVDDTDSFNLDFDEDNEPPSKKNQTRTRNRYQAKKQTISSSTKTRKRCSESPDIREEEDIDGLIGKL